MQHPVIHQADAVSGHPLSLGLVSPPFTALLSESKDDEDAGGGGGGRRVPVWLSHRGGLYVLLRVSLESFGARTQEAHVSPTGEFILYFLLELGFGISLYIHELRNAQNTNSILDLSFQSNDAIK